MLLNERSLNMYWTPAPPKWDVAPSHVKRVLFPQYHGAEYIADGFHESTVDEQIINSSSEDEQDVDHEPPR